MVAQPPHAADRKRGVERQALLNGGTSLIGLPDKHKRSAQMEASEGIISIGQKAST
jgi:hypothetical protein